MEYLNQMYVLVLTRGNGLFDATSIQEDTIEFCVEMGQTHLKGVLQFLVTELVVLFHSGNEMLVTACGVTKVMVLHKEPIRSHTISPSTTHLRAYMVVRDRQSSGTQSLTPDWEEIP